MDMKKRIFVASVITLILAGAASAQQVPEAGQGVTVLDGITITTPLRRESSLERSTSSITVIEEEEIARSPAIDLPSLLKSFTGVNIATNGGMGAAASLGLRGASSAQTLVLIDGVNVRSATAGSTALQNIPLGAIERIEIAKGPHSAQYGADAIGGVINIITRKGTAACPEGKEICTTVTAGVLHPWGGYTDANVHGAMPDGTRFNLGGRLIGTEGYNFSSPSAPFFEPDDDGFLLGSLSASAEKDYAWGQAYASALYSRSRVQFDDPGNADEADTATLAARIGTRIDHAHDWSSRLEFSLGKDDQDNFKRGTTIHDDFGTLRYGVFASTSKEFDAGDAHHTFTIGGEAYREQIDSTAVYDVTARNHGAIFAQHSVEFGELSLDGGIRHDQNELFGDATTYNFGMSYEIGPGLTARASYGTGFRAPTFNDLYWPADPWTTGNPDLKPERSRAYEIGLSWRPTDATTLDVAFYQSWVRDQINWQADSITFVYRPVNIDRVNTTGFEASLSHRFNEQWQARAWLDIRNPRDQDGRYVLRQERLKLGAEITHQPRENLELTLGVLHVGPRDDTDFNTFDRTELPAYTLVDVGATYSFDEYSRLKLSVSNLFDEQYSTYWGYPAPGRTFDFSYTRTF